MAREEAHWSLDERTTGWNPNVNVGQISVAVRMPVHRKVIVFIQTPYTPYGKLIIELCILKK